MKNELTTYKPFVNTCPSDVTYSQLKTKPIDNGISTNNGNHGNGNAYGTDGNQGNGKGNNPVGTLSFGDNFILFGCLGLFIIYKFLKYYFEYKEKHV